jgi:hypothetical protein
MVNSCPECVLDVQDNTMICCLTSYDSCAEEVLLWREEGDDGLSYESWTRFPKKTMIYRCAGDGLEAGRGTRLLDGDVDFLSCEWLIRSPNMYSMAGGGGSLIGARVAD